MTLISGANSFNTCLQAPHGHAFDLAAIAMVSKERTPSLTALKSAVRSAQFVNPKEAFSILHPVKILPSVDRSAAPTGKDE